MMPKGQYVRKKKVAAELKVPKTKTPKEETTPDFPLDAIPPRKPRKVAARAAPAKPHPELALEIVRLLNKLV